MLIVKNVQFLFRLLSWYMKIIFLNKKNLTFQMGPYSTIPLIPPILPLNMRMRGVELDPEKDLVPV